MMFRLLSTFLFACLLATAALADMVHIPADRDTTLEEHVSESVTLTVRCKSEG